MKLEFLKDKKKEILIATAIILIILFSLISNSVSFNKDKNETENTFDNENDIYNEYLDEKHTIYIHLDGAVKNRGLIELEEGDRLENAIKKGGGLLDSADLRYVNLAMMLIDGEKIYIPSKDEITDINMGVPYVPDIQESNKININKASLEDLQKIPGVGPSTAKNIITFRDKNGRFKTVDEIKKVNGIGDSKFETMLEYIEI